MSDLLFVQPRLEQLLDALCIVERTVWRPIKTVAVGRVRRHSRSQTAVKGVQPEQMAGGLTWVERAAAPHNGGERLSRRMISPTEKRHGVSSYRGVSAQVDSPLSVGLRSRRSSDGSDASSVCGGCLAAERRSHPDVRAPTSCRPRPCWTMVSDGAAASSHPPLCHQTRGASHEATQAPQQCSACKVCHPMPRALAEQSAALPD